MANVPVNATAFRDFTSRWLAKASRYRAQTLSHTFDRFFTLFVVYNRAYDEAARLVLAKSPNLYEPKGPYTRRTRPVFVSNIGDRLKATKGVVDFCGSSMRTEVFSNEVVLAALAELERLVADNRFYFFFDRDTGTPRPDLDLAALRNVRIGTVVGALEVLYQLRCNLFHGQKEFEQHQLAVLRPANEILNAVVRHLVRQVLIRSSVGPDRL